MTTIIAPICVNCTQWIESKDEYGFKCKAFPDGIPDEIIESKFDHREPHDGDNGIQFTPKDEEASKYADWLFDFLGQ